MEERAWDLPLGNNRAGKKNSIKYLLVQGKCKNKESELLVGRAEPRLENRSKNKMQALCHDPPNALPSHSPGKLPRPTEVPASL